MGSVNSNVNSVYNDGHQTPSPGLPGKSTTSGLSLGRNVSSEPPNIPLAQTITNVAQQIPKDGVPVSIPSQIPSSKDFKNLIEKLYGTGPDNKEIRDAMLEPDDEDVPSEFLGKTHEEALKIIMDESDDEDVPSEVSNEIQEQALIGDIAGKNDRAQAAEKQKKIEELQRELADVKDIIKKIDKKTFAIMDRQSEIQKKLEEHEKIRSEKAAIIKEWDDKDHFIEDVINFQKVLSKSNLSLEELDQLENEKQQLGEALDMCAEELRIALKKQSQLDPDILRKDIGILKEEKEKTESRIKTITGKQTAAKKELEACVQERRRAEKALESNNLDAIISTLTKESAQLDKTIRKFEQKSNTTDAEKEDYLNALNRKVDISQELSRAAHISRLPQKSIELERQINKYGSALDECQAELTDIESQILEKTKLLKKWG
jgi:chromosome segregation ATPase